MGNEKGKVVSKRVCARSVADNPHFEDEDLNLTYELENLRSLTVRGCRRLSTEGLMLFGQGPAYAAHLTRLDLSQLDRAEDACLAGLAALSRLAELSLAHCTSLTWEGLGFLAPLPSLKRLR